MKHLTLSLITTFAVVTSALAQAPNRVSYDAAFYAPFAPRNALDMVKQTPGFVLDAVEADELRRGFAGAVGNVLVDGQRLSAKSQTLSDVLSRIPAMEVLRIEILRGGDAAGDASGAAVLANVIRTPSAGGGWWMAGFELAAQDVPAPNGNFGWSGRAGQTEYSIGGSTYSFQRELPGSRQVFDDGSLVALRAEDSPREFSEYALNGEMKRLVGAGRLVITGQVDYSRYDDYSTLRTTALSGAPLEHEVTPYREDQFSAEAGSTYERDLADWTMTLAALVTRKRYESDVRSTHFDDLGIEGSEFAQQLGRDSGETIVRATFARESSLGRFETGAELAFNTLDATMDLTLDLGEGPFPIRVPNADVRVQEKRGEAFVSYGRPIAPKWSFDARLAVESSGLSFTGDAQQSVDLTYLKPRVQLTREMGPHQLQLRVFRDVGQLDFTDFVSAASLSDDVIDGGNPDLRPQTSWAMELGADFRLPADSALRTRIFHQWLDDVVDLVPQGPPDARLDAPGNIGRGKFHGIEASLQLPLARVLPGGRFNLSGVWQTSDVTDPVTAEMRSISEFIGREFKAELRQDVARAKLNWGIDYTEQSASTVHRIAEIDRRRESSSLDVFIETSAVPKLTVRLTMLSILGNAETRRRSFYVPDRAGVLSGVEVGERRPGQWWMLSVAGSL